MSKRYGRRPRNPNLPEEAFNTPIAGSMTETATGAKTSMTAAPSSRTMNWREEYSEVIGDLTKTAIIFVGLVVAMVALSFVVR
ncbi:MAG: hypothetical protein HC853_12440 [Anaerolineae bacterium]|nr:hypothetical protein [Anaerolineae bacterium]